MREQACPSPSVLVMSQFSSSSSSFVLGWGSSGIVRMMEGNDGRLPGFTRKADVEDDHEHDWKCELVDITASG